MNRTLIFQFSIRDNFMHKTHFEGKITMMDIGGNFIVLMILIMHQNAMKNNDCCKIFPQTVFTKKTLNIQIDVNTFSLFCFEKSPSHRKITKLALGPVGTLLWF